jgi:glycosyltransferase involved in cell wall biosynthesis
VRVLQIHAHYRQPGGEDTVVEAEAELLRAAGHSVIRHEAVNPDHLLPALASMSAAPSNPRSARRVSRLLRQQRPDVAHVHNTWFALSPSVVKSASHRGVPVVATLHNYRLLCANAQLFRDGHPCEDCVGAGSWRGVVHRCYRGSLASSAAAALTIDANRLARTWARHVDVFLALNQFSRRLFVAGGLPDDRIVVRANFAPDPGPRPQVPTRSRTVLFVGRLSEEKGPDTVLEAWARARPAGLELVVVGDGPLEADLRSRSVPGVRFAGRLEGSEVSNLLLSSRALVFPSVWYEGQPMVLVEAMAAGLPVVASALGGTGELAASNGWGRLVEAGNLDAWTDAVGTLAEDDGLDASGQRGREHYLRAHTPEVALASLEAAYRLAAERRAARS